MSAPSPDKITLPGTRTYDVKIANEAYDGSGTTTLAFVAGLNDEWSASYTVEDTDGKTIIEETNLEVTAPTATEYTFDFEMVDPNQNQIDAGYIAGKYSFSFAPPGSDPAEFFGTLIDPRPDGEADAWTATGNDPDEDTEADDQGEY